MTADRAIHDVGWLYDTKRGGWYVVPGYCSCGRLARDCPERKTITPERVTRERPNG